MNKYYITRDYFTLAITIWQLGVKPIPSKGNYNYYSPNHSSYHNAYESGVLFRMFAKDFPIKIKFGEIIELNLRE